MIRSHATYYGATITHPLSVSLTNRSEWSLSLSNQKSVSTFEDVGNFADNKTFGAELAFSQLNYGIGTVFYQRHAYRIGNYKNLIDDTKENFVIYKFSGFVRKVQPQGQSLYGRLDAQFSSKKICRLPSNIIWAACGNEHISKKIRRANLGVKKFLSMFTAAALFAAPAIVSAQEPAKSPAKMSTFLRTFWTTTNSPAK